MYIIKEKLVFFHILYFFFIKTIIFYTIIFNIKYLAFSKIIYNVFIRNSILCNIHWIILSIKDVRIFKEHFWIVDSKGKNKHNSDMSIEIY